MYTFMPEGEWNVYYVIFSVIFNGGIAFLASHFYLGRMQILLYIFLESQQHPEKGYYTADEIYHMIQDSGPDNDLSRLPDEKIRKFLDVLVKKNMLERINPTKRSPLTKYKVIINHLQKQ